MKLSEIVERVGGKLRGDGSIEITGVAGIREAQEGDITFLADPRYEAFLASTRASAVILAKNGDLGDIDKAVVVVNENPYVAFLRAIEIFSPRDHDEPRGVHPTAVIGEGVELGERITIGPHAVVEDHCKIGSGTRILAGSYIGFRSRIGADCMIFPNVTIREDSAIGDRVIIHSGTVVGSDGFGFATTGGKHTKIPQIGRVVIDDDVEIGSNVSIDRATTGITHIQSGTKIDNLVQIAHNVVIGQNSLIVAQVGISGSTEIGSNVTLAGQAGIAGHIKIGDNVKIGAQSGVVKSVPANTQYSGFPAREHSVSRRIWAAIAKLPDLLKTIKRLSKRVDALEEQVDSESISQ